MSQLLLTESPEKTKHRIERREPRPDSKQSFQGRSNPILQLQRTLGNQRVAQLIKAKRLTPEGRIIGLQLKLTVGAADDPYEQEADRVARQVVSIPDSVAMASFQDATPVEGEANQVHTLQSKPLPLAASITSFVQRHLEKEQDNEEGKVKEKKDELSTHPDPLIQRYQVPGSLDCGDIVDWLNNSSPYSPEWAQTRCTYSFNGGLRISSPDISGGGVSLKVTGHNRLTVSVNCPVDRPRWSPSRRTNRAAEVAAWNSMRATLDAHEQQHRTIGRTWRTILQDRYRTIDFTVTGTDRTEAMKQVRERVSSMQQGWIADAQAAQDAIDPFSGASLNCP